MESFTEFKVIKKFFELDCPSKNKQVMIDVGAQIGLWAIPYAKDGWKVIAYEASPLNYAALREKIDLLGLDIKLLNKAVSDHNEQNVKFYYSEEYIGINSLLVNHESLSATKFANVEMVALREDMASLGVDRVDFLKTDIEGADLLALKGFDFSKYRPSIVVSEYGGRSKPFGYDVSDLIQFGISQGYSPYVSSWKSGKSWKLGDPRVEHKLLFWGPNPDVSILNWGDVVFVLRDKEEQFRKSIECFEYAY